MNKSVLFFLLLQFCFAQSKWLKTFGGDEGMDWAGEAIDLTNDGGSIIAVDDGSFGFLKTSNI